jgi:hypothetical protein
VAFGLVDVADGQRDTFDRHRPTLTLSELPLYSRIFRISIGASGLQIAHRPTSAVHGELAGPGVSHHEPAVFELLHEGAEEALLLVFAEAFEDAGAGGVAVGLEAADDQVRALERAR